jgi:hypothetical protein
MSKIKKHKTVKRSDNNTCYTRQTIYTINQIKSIISANKKNILPATEIAIGIS